MQTKKGDIVAIIVFIAFMLVISISFLFFTYIFTKTTDILALTPLGNSTEGAAAVSVMADFGSSSLQSIFLWMFGGMLLSMMLSSFFIKTHPIFLVVYLVLFFVNIFIAIFAANAYSMMNTGEMVATYASQTITSMIMENLVRITLVANALSLVFMFAKLAFADNSGGTF